MSENINSVKYSISRTSKALTECLSNKALYNVVKLNINGFFKYANLQNNSFISEILGYIHNNEFADFSLLDLTSKLRNAGVDESTISGQLSGIDYTREINQDKPIPLGSSDYLQGIFYLGHYNDIKDKELKEIFDICKEVEWISTNEDPRFKLESIDTELDIAAITAILSPTSSIKSSFDFINESSPNKGYFPNEVITISAAPGVGKTQFCFTEALNMIDQGKKVLYVALGDMVNYYITIRLMCMHMRIEASDAYMNLEEYLTEFKNNKEIKDNFKFVVLESGQVTAHDVFNFLALVHELYDAVFIDYDGNFARDEYNLYKSGGESYDFAINVARKFNKLIFMLSQPKIGFWTAEALGMECLAESSRKQQITDAIITFGCRQGVRNRCGYAQIVKRRNGDKVFNIPWAAANSGQSLQISSDVYTELINSPTKLTVQYTKDKIVNLPDRYITE